MCLPLIPEIRKKYPDACITWLCGKQVLPLLSRVEGIDQLIAVDENRLLKASLPIRLIEILRIWLQLALRSFDLQLYFYKSPLYRILTLPALLKETRGFGKIGKGEVLPVPGRHHSHEYIRAFLAEPGPAVMAPAYPNFRHLPEKTTQNGKKKIVLACGGARNLLQNNDLRRWPLEHYRQLGQMIVSRGFELILTGAPGDAWVKDAFRDIPHSDYIGKLNLSEFIDFLSLADLLITHDSGPLHIADLAKCPVLGLFGPTRPADFRSLQEKSVFIWGGEHLSCRPCYDGKDYAICQSNECLKSISAEAVFSQMEKMLAA